MKRTFDRALFDEVVRRDAFTPQLYPLHLNRDSRIRGLCACGKSFKKSFRRMVQKGGGRCRECVNVLKDQKRIDTNMERYGCATPFQNAEVKQKIVDTNVERYGCEYPMQNAEVAERSSKNVYKVKTYTFPCGETRMVQGYEPFALDDLVHHGYTAEDVITSRKSVPEVWWTSVDGRPHRYFVDIFIPNENRMIEVKSSFTALKEGVEEKARASRDAGFVFELWVYHPNGTRVNQSV